MTTKPEVALPDILKEICSDNFWKIHSNPQRWSHFLQTLQD